MEEKTLYIIDGHSQVFKAYHAIQHLSTSTGIPTNAVFGFAQILHRLLQSRKPDYLVVTFDSAKKTLRHEYYPEYKANRPPPPEDLAIQMDYIRRILDGMRVPTLMCDGYEADDIIACVTGRAVAEGFRVFVVTADKDLLQLVNEQVRILKLEPDNETEFDREAVVAKLGVYPEQVRDMLAMVGDSSDNVPGIPRVGPKTATTLLQQFGTLEGVYENLDKVTGKQREYFEAGRDSAMLSRRLVTLDTTCPVDFELEQFRRQPPDAAQLAPLYKQLEFRKFLDDIDLPPAERTVAYRALTRRAELEAFCREARDAGRLAIDVETDSLDTILANLVGISMSIRPNEAVYIPVGHGGSLLGAPEQIPLNDVADVMRELMADPAVAKVAHNAKFDCRILRKYGLEPVPVTFDTLLGSYLLNPDRRAHGLKELADEILGVKMTPISELIGKGAKQITFAETDVAQAAPYACADADMTLQLANLFEPRVAEAGMQELMRSIELPLVQVLMDVEGAGVRIDPQHFARLGRELGTQLDALRTQIHAAAGRDFNLASPKQVAEILFDVLQLVPANAKKTGRSTDVQVLEELSGAHDVPRLMVEYRQLEKLKSTYVDVLPRLVNPKTKRLHTHYNQAVVATGRLSSNEPNLQNIPVRTELGRQIRAGFLPSSDGHVLLSADYSQIELRVLAHMSRDPALVDAYRNNADIHRLTASKVHGCAPQDVTPEMRDFAKVINFGIIYGMGAAGLSNRLKIPIADAKRFIEEYFKAYTGVSAWIQSMLEEARRSGFVSTLAGRRRYLADINSRNYNARSAAERYAVNAPIQGTSADMIKIAMINIQRWLKDSGLRTLMIMQVHDELIFDVPQDELETVQPRVVGLMREALPLDVPVEVDAKTGRNWAEC